MDLIEQVYENLSMQEGKSVIQPILQNVYFRPGISTKKLATRQLLPLPVVAAIKNELVKCGLIMQDRGVYCTAKGLQYARDQLGFLGLNESLYADIMREDTLLLRRQQLEYELAAYFDNRSIVDVTIDQSHCTIETSISRPILCIRHHALVGKSILCVGDDDLVSLSLAMLLKKLFVSVPCPARIVVVDILLFENRKPQIREKFIE